MLLFLREVKWVFDLEPMISNLFWEILSKFDVGRERRVAATEIFAVTDNIQHQGNELFGKSMRLIFFRERIEHIVECLIADVCEDKFFIPTHFFLNTRE